VLPPLLNLTKYGAYVTIEVASLLSMRIGAKKLVDHGPYLTSH